MKRQLIISFLIILFIALGTLVAIFYGKGYRLDFTPGKGILKGTGLLVATSVPDGASVFIDGHLTTATNNTINLPPGTYGVKITKDGYFSWEKTIEVDKEVVSKAAATLFPTTPQLGSITTTGALHPAIDPSFTKVAYIVASQSASSKNGVYILDLAGRSLLTLQSNATQISDNSSVNFTNATLSWSPDGKQLLATVPTNGANPSMYLLDTTTFNATPQDVTETMDSVNSSWNNVLSQKQTAQLNTLKPELKIFAMENMDILAWSPDETKLLYTASQSGLLSQIITPKIIGADSMQENRNLVKGNLYVYDTKEDKNFLIAKANQLNCGPMVNDQSSIVNCQYRISWFPDSLHLIVVHDKKVDIREYDGANNTTVYAGPFLDNYVFPWPTGESVVVLTDLGNPDTLPNLYTISLK